MKELFVSYNVALRLKEKGFSDVCLGYYFRDDFYFSETKNGIIRQYSHSEEPVVQMPLYQQVIDWLREKHDIDIIILNKYQRPNVGYFAEIKFARKDIINKDKFYPVTLQEYPKHDRGVDEGGAYYEALEKAIEEALKII